MNTQNQQLEQKEKNQAFSQIERKSFFVIVALLLSIILVSWIATYFIPQGSYLRDDAGMIIC